ncbi:ATP-dependent nuclease [Lacipirellula parvula]|uniref:ATPase AAA-type core domain-containing protein n=1 Tax=Lacipirellula parvula TaxID=2650471 RepID=A0A5K7XCD0_9BACT|nr:AAA family ATPase [Lacipirellula parvula]BBO32501.1 hypothetical protein PLANPX_2113 [Lacipirellula parvula]
MHSSGDDWYYFDGRSVTWNGPCTFDNLQYLASIGQVEPHTNVATGTMRFVNNSIAFADIEVSPIAFNPPVDTFWEDRKAGRLTVLSGPNNGGKSFLLKHIQKIVGCEGYLLGCSRFSQIDQLNSRSIARDEHRQIYRNFENNFVAARMNTEGCELTLDRIIASLNDSERKQLFKVAESLLGNKFELRMSDPGNLLSPYYVAMDGQNLRYASSGTRLLMTLLGVLLDKRFHTVLIDEPEIGLSPRIQGILSNFFCNSGELEANFPHLKHVILATHSHLFLDKRNLSNNFVVTKLDNTISIAGIKSFSELHDLQLNMLGNHLESLFLPSAIVIVEGDCDIAYLRKVFSLSIPDRTVAIVKADGDGGVPKKIEIIKQAFGDLHSSPFRERLFVVLDKVYSADLGAIEKQGVPKNNIHVWSLNGIEYYYPKAIVARAFSCDVSQVGAIDLERGTIEYNGLRRSKKQLASFVVDEFATAPELHDELADLIGKVAAACG